MAFSNFAGNLTAVFAGDGGPALNAQLNKPVCLTFDTAGNVYFDGHEQQPHPQDPDGRNDYLIAGIGGGSYSGDGGSATAAAMNFPRGVAVSASGTVYIADTANHAIRMLTASFPTISSNGVANAASFATRISPGALASVSFGRQRLRDFDIQSRRWLQLAYAGQVCERGK